MKKINSIAPDNSHGVVGLRHDEHCLAVFGENKISQPGGDRLETAVSHGLEGPSFSFSNCPFTVVVSEAVTRFYALSDGINRNA